MLLYVLSSRVAPEEQNLQAVLVLCARRPDLNTFILHVHGVSRLSGSMWLRSKHMIFIFAQTP
jgi:hypothetical protein